MDQPNTAMENYIYYKQDNWYKKKHKLYQNLGDLDVTKAYQENADRLETNLSIPSTINMENFVSNVQRVLNIKKTKKEKVIIDESLQSMLKELIAFVQTELKTTLIGDNLTIGQVSGGAKLDQSRLKLNQIIKGLQFVKNEFDKFDNSFQNMGLSQVSIISTSGMEKTALAYQKLDSFLQKYGGINNVTVAWDTMLQELKQVCGSLTGDLKGGLLEFGDYMHSIALKTAHQSVQEAVSVIGATLTGTDDTTLLSAIDGLDQTQFVNKADNVVNIRYTENNMTIEVNLGISDKSYTKGSAHGKNIASNVNWNTLMTVNNANLTNTAFEYYYANLFIHERESLMQPNEFNNYLAAKASSFLIAGVENAVTPQAYFIRYSNRLVYVPTLLRQMATKKKGLTVKPKLNASSATINEYVGNSPSMSDAFIRTKNTISNLRKQVQFNGIIV